MLNLVNMLFTETPSAKTCGCASLWEIRGLISTVWSVITIIQFGIPIILIILGMLDLGKAVAAGEEKEIKDSQKLLMKRALSAVAVFFIIAIVSLILRLLPAAPGSGLNIAVCREGDILAPTEAKINTCEVEGWAKEGALDKYQITAEELQEAKDEEN
ncbi:MAG: hypothetical protein WCX96_05050 [Bacilli bacterium]